jgi:tRNA/tmRNA/rRNA uracil-C5-methylase (TrmA/RlmC/RlmD family)
VSAGGFWQTHPAAAEAYLQRVLSATAPRAGERALDLYAGAGLFTAGLAQAVGEHGRVLSVEADLDAVEHARRNLARLPAASPRQGSVTATAIQAMVAELGGVDVVVLDPPRTGAGREVMSALTESGARVICYVACDPAALARDVRTSLELGWELRDLAAFDAFPMTHHVECIATLQPAPQCA